MSPEHPTASAKLSTQEYYPDTPWTIVFAAARSGSPPAAEALARLCGLYWRPVYGIARCLGLDSENAKDVAQTFFARILEKDVLADLQPEKGRLRSWLKAAVRNLVANQANYERRLKRGGGAVHVMSDLNSAGVTWPEPLDSESPDRVFDRWWARSLLERVVGRLAAECDGAERQNRFAVLKEFLPGGGEPRPLEAAASALGMSVPAVKSLVFRLRERYRELLRAEVQRTLQDPAEVESELRDLFAALQPAA